MKEEKRIVWIAALVQFVNIVDFMMVMPLGPDLSKALPVTNSDIGIICGCYTLSVGVSGIICAKFLDKFDRKSVALFAVAGLAFANLGATFSWDLYSMIASRVVAGVFGGQAVAIAMSMVTDAVPPERRGRAMAVVMGSFSVSSIAAIPFGLELARIGSWKTPFYGIFILGCIVFLLICFFTPPMREHLQYKKEEISMVKFLSNSNYLLAFVMMATAMISSYAIIPNISAFFQLNLGYPRESLGFLYLVGGVFSLVLIQIGGRSSDKIGPVPTNIVGTIFLVVFLYDGFMHTPVSSEMIIFVMFMGTVCFRNVSATTEASKLPAPFERAAFMSFLSSLQHIGNGIGALLSSAILITNNAGKLVNMEWVGLLAIGTALVQPVILIIIRNSSKKAKMENQQRGQGIHFELAGEKE